MPADATIPRRGNRALVHWSKRLAAVLLVVVAGLCASARAETVEPLPVTEVAPGVYVFEGERRLVGPANRGLVSNIGFVVGERAVAVVDTGGSHAAGAALLAAIRQRTGLPVAYVVNTHMHPDHVLGNAAFRGEAPAFVGHHKLARALAARAGHYLDANRRLLGEAAFAGTVVVPPTVAVEGVVELDLGGRILELEAHATAHTDNDLTVLDRATGTMFLGDLLFVGHVPALDGSLRGWLTVIETLKARSFARVVPGHGPASLAWPAAVAPQERYLSGLARDIRAYLAAGRSLAEAARTIGLAERGAWELFDEFNARNVTAGYAELEWE